MASGDIRRLLTWAGIGMLVGAAMFLVGRGGGANATLADLGQLLGTALGGGVLGLITGVLSIAFRTLGR